jgi:hypothetical protein
MSRQRFIQRAAKLELGRIGLSIAGSICWTGYANTRLRHARQAPNARSHTRDEPEVSFGAAELCSRDGDVDEAYLPAEAGRERTL